MPNGTYKWLLFPGTTLEATGRIGDMVRVRLDAALEAWAGRERRDRPAGRHVRAASYRGECARRGVRRDWVDVVIPTGERPAFEVREEGNRLVLILYGVQANTDIIGYIADDSLVRRVRWYQETSDRARFEIDLARAPYGYLPGWDRGAFTLRMRRPPAINDVSSAQGPHDRRECRPPACRVDRPDGAVRARCDARDQRASQDDPRSRAARASS